MSIFRSVFTISFYISLSRIMGFIRDILIARYLGVSIFSDAFFAAFRLPNFFRRVFAEGAFNSAFVPIFIEKLQDKKTDQDELIFVRNVFSLLFYFLLIFVIVFQIFMPFFMKILFPGFFTDAYKADLLVSLSRVTIFYLIFISLVSLLSGVLNSLNKFAVPASAPIILNGTLVASIFIFGPFAPNYAVALSWGVFIAGVLQFIWLFVFSVRSGFLVYPKIPNFDADIRKFFRKLGPGIIGANVMQINLLIDSIFASMTAGAVSYLYYADRINQLPLAMIGIAIGIALLPALSRNIKSNKNAEAIKLQNLALEAGLILVIPAALALNILSYPIISTLFERGKFTTTESIFVSQALAIYAIGLPSYVLVKVMEPAFFARGNTKTPMKIAFVCLTNNVVCNLFFYFIKFGFLGIVISSVISTYLNLSLFFIILIKQKYFKFEKGFLRKFILIIIPAIIMALSLIFLRNYFYYSEKFHIIVELIIIIAVGLVIYFISSYISGSLKILMKSNLLNKTKPAAKKA